MKKLAFASFLLCVLILFGCPARTEKSMDQGSYEVPAWLSGNWYILNDSNKISERYNIQPVQGKTGHLLVYTIKEDGSRQEPVIPCILSNVGGQVFLSAYMSGSDWIDKGWYILKFREISNREFELLPVKENAINYSAAPDEIIAFLKKNKDNAGIYELEDTGRYLKAN